jgi:hypothetical protein
MESGPLVILSAAKDLAQGTETLRGVSPERSEWAQHDTTDSLVMSLVILSAALSS